MGATPRLTLLAGIAAALLLAGAGAGLAQTTTPPAGSGASGPIADCIGDGSGVIDNNRRIEACTALLGSAFSNPAIDAEAYASRALAYSLKGQFEQSIRDYDAALKINPNFGVALNNRAWAYFRSGRPDRGLPDVEKALRINPGSPHAWDTRAHIRQSGGDKDGALRDYEMAIQLGGEKMVKIYQCGLAERGLYKGRRDGVYGTEVKEALLKCIADRTCDPLPADEQCRDATS